MTEGAAEIADVTDSTENIIEEVIELLSLPPELVEAICHASGASGCASLMACSKKALSLVRSDAVWEAITRDEFPIVTSMYPALTGALKRRRDNSFFGLKALSSLNNGLVTVPGPLQPSKVDGEHRLSGGTATMFQLVATDTNGSAEGSILWLGAPDAACPGIYFQPNSTMLQANIQWASAMNDGLARCAPLEVGVAYSVLLLSWRMHLDWFARVLVVRDGDGVAVIDEEAQVDRPPRSSSPIRFGNRYGIEDEEGEDAASTMADAPCTLRDLIVISLSGLPRKEEHLQPTPDSIDALVAMCEAAHPSLSGPLLQLVEERRQRVQPQRSRERRLFLSGNPPGCVNCSSGEATVAGFDHCPHSLLCATCANSGGFRSRGSRHMALMLCRICRSLDLDMQDSDQ